MLGSQAKNIGRSAFDVGRSVFLRMFEPDRRPALVRLRRQEDGAVEVRSCAVKNRAVSNRNCVAAMRGGEQRNENDQSVTQVGQEGPPP